MWHLLKLLTMGNLSEYVLICFVAKFWESVVGSRKCTEYSEKILNPTKKQTALIRNITEKQIALITNINTG